MFYLSSNTEENEKFKIHTSSPKMIGNRDLNHVKVRKANRLTQGPPWQGVHCSLENLESRDARNNLRSAVGPLRAYQMGSMDWVKTFP